MARLMYAPAAGSGDLRETAAARKGESVTVRPGLRGGRPAAAWWHRGWTSRRAWTAVRAGALTLAALALTVACSGGSVAAPAVGAPGPTPSIPGTNPPPVASPAPAPATRPAAELVLALDDAPAGFAVSEDVPRSIDDVAKGFADPVAGRARLEEMGFRSSHRRELRRSGLFGALAIVSTATVYGADVGARNGFRVNTESIAQREGVQRVSLGTTIGDESAGFTWTAKDDTGNYTLRHQVAYWRVANVSHVVHVIGVDGTVDMAEAVGLAQKQAAKSRR